MVKNERPDREPETPVSPEVGSAYAEHGENFALADSVLSRRTGRESRAESPILGHYFKLPGLSGFIDPDQPTLDTSLPYIPVYTHLITHELAPIERPTTPTIIRTLRSSTFDTADVFRVFIPFGSVCSENLCKVHTIRKDYLEETRALQTTL